MNYSFDGDLGGNGRLDSENALSLRSPKRAFSGHDAIFAWLCTLMGILLARAVPITQNTFGAFICFCLLFSLGAVYIKLSGVRQSKSSVCFFAVALVFSLGLITGSNKAILTVLAIFIFCAFLYWVYSAFGLNGGRVLGKDLLMHGLTALFGSPVLSVWYIFPAFAHSEGDGGTKKAGKTVLLILAGLGCAFIPTAIVIFLLSYDKQFTDIMNKILAFDVIDVIDFVGDLFFGMILAMMIFGVLFGSKLRRRIYGGEKKWDKKLSLNVMPRVLLCSMITPILAVYAVFFVSQWDYYISAFTGSLPEPLTYAEYARSGFFQLCAVCAINALLLLMFSLLLGKKENKKGDALKTVYSSVISVFTLILIATALSKMILYIDSYGLTRKRVYASWLMILLAVIFAVVLLRLVIKKISLPAVTVAVCIVFFGIIALPDTDAMIASYNADAYLFGELSYVDVESMADYGDSAVPALVRLYESLDKEELSETERALYTETEQALRKLKFEKANATEGIFSFNIPSFRAKLLLNELSLDK